MPTAKQQKLLQHTYRYDDLPEELRVEILCRLSIKRILVCKCVGKSWCRLIESPYFVETHHRLVSSFMTKPKAESETTELLLICILRTFQPQHDFPHGPGLYILPSKSLKPSSSSSSSPWDQLIEFPEDIGCSPQHCRGLVSFTQFIRKVGKVAVVVVNPATREFRELPKVDPIKNTLLPCSYVVFDQSSNSYKVLLLPVVSRSFIKNPKPGVLLLARIIYVINLVKDVSWREVVIPDDDEEEDEYWVFPSLHHRIPRRYPTRPGGRMKILVFDAEHEDFRITFNFLHVSQFANVSLRTVAACKGSFYIFSSSLSSDKLLDVWVLKDYKMSKVWVKETSCDLKILYEATATHTDDQFECSTRGIIVHGVIGHGIIIKLKKSTMMPGFDDAVYGIYDTTNKRLQGYEVEDKVLAKYMEEESVVHAEFNASLVSPNRGY